MAKRPREVTPESRLNVILEHVMAEGFVSVDELAKRLGVSRMTVHRDLDRLERKGLLRKVRGGASVEPSVVFESNFHYRSQLATVEKRAAARAAARLLEPGQAVMIDDSTTTSFLAELLPELVPITVITNGLTLINELRDIRGINLIALGGNYNHVYNAFTGILCEQAIQTLRADVLLMSTSAVHGTSLYHQDEHAAKIKRAMIDSCAQRIFLVDASKFEKSALIRFADLREFDKVLIGGMLNERVFEELSDKQIPFEVVTPDA